MERQVERPLPAKTVGFALKQTVIGFRAARIIALDIEHVPPPDQARSALASWLRRVTSKQVHYEAMLNGCCYSADTVSPVGSARPRPIIRSGVYRVHPHGDTTRPCVGLCRGGSARPARRLIPAWIMLCFHGL